MQADTIKDIINDARDFAQHCEFLPAHVIKCAFEDIANRLERLSCATPQTQPRKHGMTANDKHVLAYNMDARDVAISVSADRQTLYTWTLTGTVDGRHVIIAGITGGTTLARTCCFALCRALMGYRTRNRRKRQLRAARAAAAAKEVQ